LASEIQPHTNRPDPERRLKLGYVSPDLYGHPVAKFMLPVFERHDRSRFERRKRISGHVAHLV
jgi:predicted O-linked N-acetylglucosamine transferase (SPINDLY family)